MELEHARIGLVVRLNPNEYYSREYNETKLETTYRIIEYEENSTVCRICMHETTSTNTAAIRQIEKYIAVTVNLEDLIIVKPKKIVLVWK